MTWKRFAWYISGIVICIRWKQHKVNTLTVKYDLLDAAPFVELLAKGGFQVEADINQDGLVDLLDIFPFVELLSGS